MHKLLLMSVIVAIVAGPAIAARDPVPVRGVKRMVVFLLAFNLAYAAALQLVYVPFFVPEWIP